MADDAHYTDPDCRYLGGDPRLQDRGRAEVRLFPQYLEIEMKDAEASHAFIRIPAQEMEQVYGETQELGMEQVALEEGIKIGPSEHVLRFMVVVVRRDPEEIYPGGFHVRLAFRNDYFSQLFIKRLSNLYGVPPF